MKSVELYAAKVKFAAQKEPLQTTNGPRINCVVVIEATGEEVKLWDNPNGLIQFLSKGEQIQLAKDAKGRWAIAGAPPAEAPPDPPRMETKQPAPTHASSEDVRQFVAIYREIKSSLPDALPECWRNAAIAIYMERAKSARQIRARVLEDKQ